MKLQSVQIKNYRSIEDISFEINPLDDSTYTYGLIGVNEAGKSSILKALALKEKGLIKPAQKDFKNKTIPVEITYFYELEENDINDCKGILSGEFPPMDNIVLNRIALRMSYNYINPDDQTINIEILDFEHAEKNTIQEKLKQHILNHSHKVIFWTAEDRFLISQPIDLAEFSSSPESVSIPLLNCFKLTGITNIQESITSLANDSTEVEQLQTELGEKVTEHIKTVWPSHPIKITFLIDGGLINFHIKDVGSRGKAKTADQRSDGFKQFVSFLLTVSAQDRNEELSNAVILLDEPETHLHPQAQEYLLNELIKITKNKRNNIVFFATHSNYMIDKSDLSRNYRIEKANDENTKNDQLDKKISTYASVSYEVFDIPSTDYHNELYSRVHEIYQDADVGDEKRAGILNFDTNFLNIEKGLKKDKPWKGNQNHATLSTYIRNCIHHPDNGNKYTNEELRKSISLLISFI